MNENENLVPKRRFKEFTNSDAWEQRKLVEELSLLKDGTHGTHIDTENGPYLLSAKNIKNGRVNITPADRKISIEEFNKIHTNFSLQAGDVLLTIVGSIGETAVLNNADNITFQRSVAYLRPKSMNSQFLYTTISGPLFQKELKNRQVVSAQPGIYLGDLAKIDITIPDIVEQTAIASFFKQLDDTIALHQRKLEKSKALKSAYLSEMFPAEGERKPKRRFAGFTDDWEQRDILEISKVFIGLVTTMTENYRNEGTLLIRNSDIKENRFEFSDNPIHLDEAFAENNSSRRLIIGDVITIHTGDIGTSAVIGEREDGAIGFATINTRPNQDVLDSNYLSTYFNTEKHKNYAIKVSTGDGRSNYNLKDFNRLSVPLPLLDEQKKIGFFFKQLNDTIALHQHKLEKLQNIKKAYLKELFV